MTPKEERFVAEYLIDLNATQAAKRAGYSQKTAYSIGQENLKKPEIKMEIQKAMKARARRTRITQDQVLRELAVVAISDIGDYLDFTADEIKLKPPKSICGQSRRTLAAWKTRTTKTSRNDRIIETRTDEFKLWDKLSALEKIMKHLGMLQEKDPLGVLLALLPEELREPVRQKLAEQLSPGKVRQGGQRPSRNEKVNEGGILNSAGPGRTKGDT